MVIDTPAILTILFNEEEVTDLAIKIETDAIRLMSAANMLETMIIVEARKGESGVREFELMLYKANIEVVSFTKEHAEIAHQAWRKYGKGNHPAGLNLGDCFAYALAKTTNEPLLFKGDDFAKTDIRSAY